MFGAIIASVATAVTQSEAVIKQQQAYIKSLPETERQNYIINKMEENRILEQHRRNLEVAEALRPRNFCGQ